MFEDFNAKYDDFCWLELTSEHSKAVFEKQAKMEIWASCLLYACNEKKKLEDIRIRIDNQGFSAMKKRLTYFGTYSFHREPYEMIFRWEEWQSVYINYKGENGWNGKSALWAHLINQDVVPTLRKNGMK